MSGFVKIYGKILKSSVWVGQPAHLRLTWIALLVLADRQGDVMSSVPGLAQDAGVTIPEVLQALEKFKSPDPFSRTPDNEGRRILEIDGGWHVLNHDKYREMRSESQVKNAARQAKFKAKRRVEQPAFEAVTAAVSTVTGNPVDGVTGNTTNDLLCTLYSDQSLEDPDPDPTLSRDPKDPTCGARVLPPGEAEVPAPMTCEVPEWWKPKARHVARCTESALDVTLELARFRTTHFQIPFPNTEKGVDKRFERWLVDGHARIENERAKQLAASGAPKASRPRVPGLPAWVHPDHAAFAREHRVLLRAEATAFRDSYHHPPDALNPGEVFKPFMDHLVKRAADSAPRAASR